MSIQNARDDCLGIDIGGVIMDRANDNTDTSFFSDNYLATTATEGCFDAVSRLVRERFGENTHIVSKCGKNIERKSREWLSHHEFFSRTGIPETHLHFCRQRHEKAPICRDIGVTHFIDDRASVLEHLETVPNRLLFQPTGEERHRGKHIATATVWSWNDILALLL